MVLFYAEIERKKGIATSIVLVEKLDRLSKNSNHQGADAQIQPIEFYDLETLIEKTIENEKQVNRNIGLSFDFVRHLISNPSSLENLPNKLELEFIEKDFRASSSLEGKEKQLVKVKNAFEMI